MIHESNALVLEILKHAKGLKMSVFEQKDAVLTVRHYSQCALSFHQIEKLCQELTFVLNSANKKGLLEDDALANLKKISQLLWDHLLTRPIKERLMATHNQDLILSFDEELIDIPWELLYDGHEFLCLKFNLGRLVRTKQKAHITEYRSLTAKPKMLILVNPTDDLKSAYSEGVHIKNQLDKAHKRIVIDFKSTQIDSMYIRKNLRDYDIVHYAGHCEYDSENPKNSGWILRDGRFTIRDVEAMGETMPLPTIVFSNACQSAGALASAMNSDYQKKAYNLASAFLFSGVRHYIGTVRRIEDEVSFAFAREFYSQLLKGKSVGECIRLSRMRLIREYGLHSIFWAGYLLYGNPNLVLFRRTLRHHVSSIKTDFARFKKPLATIAAGFAIIAFFSLISYWLPSVNPGSYFLLRKSNVLFAQGRNQEVIALCRALVRKEPDLLSAYPLLTGAYQRIGKSEEALKYNFEYAFFSQRKKDYKNLASAYINIGWLYQQKGEYDKALGFYTKALTLAQEHKDRLHESGALRKMAVWHMDRGENDKALELLTKSSEINRARQYYREYAYNLACDYFDMGLLFFNKNDLATAREFYEKSLNQFKGLKLKTELSDCYFNTGEIYLFEKQYEKALEFYMKGMAIDSEQGNNFNLASDYGMIGELYAEMGNSDKAEEYLKKSLEMSRQIHAPVELASAYFNLGLLYKSKGWRNKARDNFRSAQEIYSSINTAEYEKVKKELLDLNPPTD